MIRVFTHDLANFDNSFSQQQLDRVVDPACTGEPYFRDSEVKMLRFTIVANGEKTLEEFIQEAQHERLPRRKKKKVESNYYRSPPNHKLAPVLEQALGTT